MTYRASLVVGACVASLGVALAALTGVTATASSTHAKVAPCEPAGAKTVAAGDAARVYRKGGVTYACLYKTGKTVDLGLFAQGCEPPCSGVGDIAVAGRFVAFESLISQRGASGTSVEEVDLRSGHTSRYGPRAMPYRGLLPLRASLPRVRAQLRGSPSYAVTSGTLRLKCTARAAAETTLSSRAMRSRWARSPSPTDIFTGLTATRRGPRRSISVDLPREGRDPRRPRVQFTPWAFGHTLTQAGICPSMGAVGSADDNALMESFRGRCAGRALQPQRWNTRIELAGAIHDYIELWHQPSPQALLARDGLALKTAAHRPTVAMDEKRRGAVGTTKR